MEPDVSTGNPPPASESAKGKKALQKPQTLTQETANEILDANGLVSMIQAGLDARTEKTIKNRIIFGLFVVLGCSITANFAQYKYQPEPKLLAETTDGRIRKLPLLNDPMYSQKEILAWSQKCVESAYRLS